MDASSHRPLPDASDCDSVVHVAERCLDLSALLGTHLPWILLITLIALSGSIASAHTTARGKRLTRLSIALILALQVGTLAAYAHVAKERESNLWSSQAAAIVDHLAAQVGRHLIFVR